MTALFGVAWMDEIAKVFQDGFHFFFERSDEQSRGNGKRQKCIVDFSNEYIKRRKYIYTWLRRPRRTVYVCMYRGGMGNAV